MPYPIVHFEIPGGLMKRNMPGQPPAAARAKRKPAARTSKGKTKKRRK